MLRTRYRPHKKQRREIYLCPGSKGIPAWQGSLPVVQASSGGKWSDKNSNHLGVCVTIVTISIVSVIGYRAGSTYRQ